MTTAENDFAGNLVIVRGALIQARLETSRASTVLKRGRSEKRGIARRVLVNGVGVVTPATYRMTLLLDTVTRLDTKYGDSVLLWGTTLPLIAIPGATA